MRKGRLMSKTATAVMIAASMMAMQAMPVFAEGTNYSTTIGGETTTSFTKYLTMDADANVPNATFTYNVTAGTAEGTVLAGVDADKVTMAGVDTEDKNTIKFAASDEKKETGAEKTATLDFSACKFTEPGVYRYILTESGDNDNQAVTNDTHTTRTIDVYVNDASDNSEKKLAIGGYVFSYKDGESEVKSGKFTNSYDTSDLTIRKEVTGNQASRDKYFKFTLNIEKAVAGTVYTVELPDSACVKDDQDNLTVNGEKALITVGENGTATATFYLMHGQEIKIDGIAKGTTYNVTEDAEDYHSEAAKVDGYTDETSGTVESKDLKTSYLNTREGTIPTGVIMTVAPFAVVTLLGGLGAARIMMKKKDDEE